MSLAEISPTAVDAIPDAELRAKIPQLIRIAEEIFPGRVTFEIDEDPEVDGEWYVVFNVVLTGDPSQALPRRHEWYSRTWAILERRCSLIRLSIQTTE